VVVVPEGRWGPGGLIDGSLRAEAEASQTTVSGAGGHVNARSLRGPGNPGETLWRRLRGRITLGGVTPAEPRSDDAPRADRPSEAVCAAVTIALAAYLIGLVLAVATNSLGGSSPLLGTIKSRVFSPVLVPAWLDLGYDYRLTYGGLEDADHDLTIAAHDDASAAVERPGDRRGERAARWRRLARTIASGNFDEDGSVVAAGAARGGFRLLQVGDVEITVDRLQPPERNASTLDATRQEASTARIRRVEGDVQLIRKEPPSELAPRLRPAAPPRSSPEATP